MRRLRQHLLLRGSVDFASLEAYDGFVAGILRAANAKRQKALAEELACMRPLAVGEMAEYREYAPVVSGQSLIRVRKNSYSVPSRLIGHTLRVELYEAELKVYLGRDFLLSCPRLRGDRGSRVDFRHVIGPLLRKPGAFLHYRHREALYPSVVFRAVYDRLVADHGERSGVIEYLHVLKLAAEETVEKVEPLLRTQLARAGKWRATEVRDQVAPTASKIIELPELTPTLSAEAENWGYRSLLVRLCEAEAADRRERKRSRLLRESGLPSGKTLGNLDEAQLPPKVRRQLPTLLEGGFLERGENLLVFGLPGRGKTHFLCALGREMVLRRGCPVLFTPTFKLVQQLLAAKKDLRLAGLLRKLDRFETVILDDLGYVEQSREEMEVLFTFLAERYERRSVWISSNLVFSKWDQIFKDPMTTMAAVDRLVHHAIILEFNGESLRVTREKAKGGS
jgi:DNA replication protein DnaC